MHKVLILDAFPAYATLISYRRALIAAALGISDATLSRMFPKGFAKEIAKITDRRLVGGTESA